MTVKSQAQLLTISRLNQIPYLVHGFGTAGWKESDIKRKKEWESFRLVYLKQIHSDRVHFIDKVPSKKLSGDALVTSVPFILLTIKTADCLPVLIVDELRRVIAAVHCGWRGTVKKVLEKTIQGLKEHHGSSPSSLLVAFGPCIGPKCYEVGEDVRQSFRDGGFPAGLFQRHPEHPKKFLLDLREANLLQLQSQGVLEENIFVVEDCTHCHNFYYSYRKNKDIKARMLSFIGMLF
jgi:YfiH family protein